MFNSNPDFIDASEGFTGKAGYQIDEIGLLLWRESGRENSMLLAIRLQDTGELIGCAATLVPNPEDDVPWIGLLVIDAHHQGRRLGREAAEAIEACVAASGWKRLRLNVLTALPRARRFWERLGYAVTGEHVDTNGRAVWSLENKLPATADALDISASVLRSRGRVSCP